jgi:hypothetical protein
VGAFFRGSEIHRLCLSPVHYSALLDFIAASFRRRTDGDVLAGGSGLYGESSFYDAVGTYTILNTCNTWTARGLKSAGYDISTAFKATAGSVMRYLRKQDSAHDDHCEPQARSLSSRWSPKRHGALALLGVDPSAQKGFKSSFGNDNSSGGGNT